MSAYLGAACLLGNAGEQVAVQETCIPADTVQDLQMEDKIQPNFHPESSLSQLM